MVETPTNGKINVYSPLDKECNLDLMRLMKLKNHFSKYTAKFDYFDKTLSVLSAASGSVSIASFATSIGAPVGTVSASFGLVFSIRNGIVKKLLKITRKKKKV